MNKKSATKFALDHDRLAAANDDYEAGPTFNACLNVHGTSETMRFGLRLSPRNHLLMENIGSNKFDTSSVTAEVLQPYST